MNYNLIFLLTCAVVSTYGLCPWNKPGICPKPQGPGICIVGCSGDSNCTGIQKCCPNGCGVTCQTPILPVEPGPFFEKPGFCPILPPGTIGICIQNCTGDFSCRGRQKCCSNGCGVVCKDPVFDKPGSCPKLPPGSVGPCVELCENDCSCYGNQKCCFNGCGHVCRFPV